MNNEMKLQVRIMSATNGPVLTVCDEHGEPLPNQERVELFNSIEGLPKVSVTFVIDDKAVRLFSTTRD